MNLQKANKAHAGGIAGAVAVLVVAAVEHFTGQPVGVEVQTGVAAIVGWLIVWQGPANK